MQPIFNIHLYYVKLYTNQYRMNIKNITAVTSNNIDNVYDYISNATCIILTNKYLKNIFSGGQCIQYNHSVI